MGQEYHPINSRPSNYKTDKKSEFEPYQILKSSKSKIKKSWEKKVREQIPAAQGESPIVMLNSLEIFLDELTGVLKLGSIMPGSIENGMSKIHGQDRAAIVGYFLPQLLTEFSILRQVITEKLYEHEVLTFEVRSLIDKAIDFAISLAATEFVSAQQKNLKAAFMKAEMSNRDLEQFAGIAAHDLKSPLATISGYLDLLEEELSRIPQADAEVEYITVMKNASARMLSLIDRLLDYSRLTKTPRPFQSVNLNEVIKNSLQNLSSAIKETNTKIVYDDLPTVLGDSDMLTQVFQNLFANSIKFSGPESPNIHVSVDSNKFPGVWLFAVKDNGIGFDPKDKENIFTLYKSLHTENKYQGAGIGLATCRKVIEFHGGRIWAESDFRKGSQFFFTLPKP